MKSSSFRAFLGALNIALVIVVIAWLHSPPHGYGYIEIHWLTDHLPEWSVALFTGLLVWATAGLRRSTDKLWEAGERQISVAQKSAEAAEASAKIADAGLRITQRAYLSVEPRGIGPFQTRRSAPGSVEEILGRLAIRNVGHLPARDVQWIVRIHCDERRDWRALQYNDDEFVGNNVIPPGTAMAKGTKTIPSTNLLLFDAAKQRYCYVWGRVRYRDGFGELRTTNFCHRYNCEARTENNTIPKVHARYHDYGNDGD